jgi:hypothetical protein
MDERLRALFNRHWSEALYRRMCGLMDERLQTRHFEFRLAETPLFLPEDLRRRCVRVADEILGLIRKPEVIEACQAAVPERYQTPGSDRLPHFLAIDLGIVRGPDGDLEPRLIELQGFSSLYGMQLIQGGIWGEVAASIPGMPERFTPMFSGLEADSYLDVLRRTVIADADPAEVILLDLDPRTQKTVPDFRATARLLGVRAVCVTELRREGRRLFAPLPGGGTAPVRRILHRVVFDELERRRVPMCYDYRDDLDVVWVSHPNWYWVWSKYTLPFIEHPSAPRTWRLDRLERLPDDLSSYILKPIFSFAGRGVVVDLDGPSLRAIPEAERSNYLLQEKVSYAPALHTPEGDGVKAEIRMMYLRPENTGDLLLAINLVRLSRGKMHGVDHNKGLTWVGSSVAIWPADQESVRAETRAA